jgi:hypothetical protein
MLKRTVDYRWLGGEGKFWEALLEEPNSITSLIASKKIALRIPNNVLGFAAMVEVGIIAITCIAR